jgi:hypothetical protein
MKIRYRIVNTVTYAACALLLSVRVASAQAPAPDAAQERQFEEAMRTGRPIAGLDVTVASNLVQLNRAEYRVPVMIRVAPGSDLAPAGGDGARMDVLALVTDSMGLAVQNLRDQIVLDADQATRAAARPIAYAMTFTLLPGTYTVQVALRDPSTGRIGTADASFVVRNLAKNVPRP